MNNDKQLDNRKKGFYWLFVSVDPGGCRKSLGYMLDNLHDVINIACQELTQTYLTLWYGQSITLQWVEEDQVGPQIDILPYLRMSLCSPFGKDNVHVSLPPRNTRCYVVPTFERVQMMYKKHEEITEEKLQESYAFHVQSAQQMNNWFISHGVIDSNGCHSWWNALGRLQCVTMSEETKMQEGIHRFVGRVLDKNMTSIVSQYLESNIVIDGAPLWEYLTSIGTQLHYITSEAQWCIVDENNIEKIIFPISDVEAHQIKNKQKYDYTGRSRPKILCLHRGCEPWD